MKALEASNERLEREMRDAETAIEAEKRENIRINIEKNFIKVNVDKLKIQLKEKIEDLERDQMYTRKQNSSQIDIINEYERRYGYLADIKKR